jgi:hypothetical protein
VPRLPLKLEYRSPRAADGTNVTPDDTGLTYVNLPSLVIATAVFAAAHLMTEYACETFYHFHGVAPGTFAYQRASHKREVDLAIETGVILLCTAPFFIMQGLLRPNSAARVRPHAWLAAAVAGVTFCLTRWAVYFVFPLSDWADLCAALALSAALATAVSFYRWPRGL